MNTCVTKFMSCDVLATHTVRKSGVTLVDFRKDAKKYCIKRLSSEFKFETAYDYLKDKPKWLQDANHHQTDGKVGKKKIRSTPAKAIAKIRASDGEEKVVGEKLRAKKRPED